jgi:glycosyltransferase involved in cell wall biosynthesis
LAIADRVHFLGFRRDTQRWLAVTDVFLHPAVRDPHPRAVLEAMAAGLPVVAFDVDGVSETVVDGVTGRLVRPLDVQGLTAAVLSLARSPRRREEMGGAGRERVRVRFTAGQTSRGVDRVITAVLDGRGPTVHLANAAI